MNAINRRRRNAVRQVLAMMQPLESRRMLSVTVATLASFNGTDGAGPLADLVMDAKGDLYGVAATGGTNNDGTIFEVAAGSKKAVDVSDAVGYAPNAGLSVGPNGDIVGTTEFGGAGSAGTVFQIAPGSTTVQTIAAFNTDDGANPMAGLTMDAKGDLFGTTADGGEYSLGTVFEISAKTTSINPLFSFWGNYGVTPEDGVVLDSKGDIFGTTTSGGANSYGTVFDLSAKSGMITLASFNSGVNQAPVPNTQLVLDSSGDIFGTTAGGGTYGDGMVFEAAAGSTTATVLASFNGTNGNVPNAGLSVDSKGNVFGTTQLGGAKGVGEIFEVAAGTKVITTVASFNNANGYEPSAGLIKDAQGNLFGATAIGGSGSKGTAYELAFGSKTITDLASFDGAKSGPAAPTGDLIFDSAGNLYGTTGSGGTANDGTVFEASGVESSSTVAQLGFVQSPSKVKAGASEAAITIKATDSGGKVVAGATVTLGISSGPKRAPIIGTLTQTTDSSGIATFSGISFHLAGSYTLAASSGAVTSAKSTAFTVTPAAARSLVFTTLPNKVAHKKKLTVCVAVEDAYGNVLTKQNTGTITLALGSTHPKGAVLRGTKTATVTAGVATFTTLTLSLAGTYTLTASDSLSLPTDTSKSFVLS